MGHPCTARIAAPPTVGLFLATFEPCDGAAQWYALTSFRFITYIIASFIFQMFPFLCIRTILSALLCQACLLGRKTAVMPAQSTTKHVSHGPQHSLLQNLQARYSHSTFHKAESTITGLSLPEAWSLKLACDVFYRSIPLDTG